MDFKTDLPSESNGPADPRPESRDNDEDQIIDLPEGEKVLETTERPSGNWASSAARYEWDGTYGEVAPRVPELEEILFGSLDLRGRTGLDFECLLRTPVCLMSEKVKFERIASFGDAGIHPVMLDNIELCGYKVPTPIQQYCIPAISKGLDLLACAQTGSGKTAAFLVPILSKLMGKAKKLAAPRPTAQTVNYKAEPLVLVIAPTRELATQIFDESRRFCYRSMLRPCVVYGGADIYSQRSELEKGCDLLVATPGRLLDFLERGRSLSLKRVRYAVVDEADQMLDMGFGPQIRSFFLHSDMNRDDNLQITMFSATYPSEIMQLATDFLSDDHVQISVGRVGSTHEHITQRVVYVEEEDKKETLSEMLLSSPPTRTLIFANHKSTIDSLDEFLWTLSFPCTSVHSDRTQREREDALRSFKSGRCPIMLATNVASRGLDIKNIMHIINYDLPQDIDEYVHRIGRTARIGNRGLATSFFNDANSRLGGDLYDLLSEAHQEIPEFLEQYKGLGTRPVKKKDDPPEYLAGFANVKPKMTDKPTQDGDGWEATAPNSTTKENDGDGWGATASNTTTKENDGDGWGATASNTTAKENDGDDWGATAPNSTTKENDGDGWAAPASNTTTKENDEDGRGATASNTTTKENDGDGWAAAPNTATNGNDEDGWGSAALNTISTW